MRGRCIKKCWDGVLKSLMRPDLISLLGLIQGLGFRIVHSSRAREPLPCGLEVEGAAVIISVTVFRSEAVGDQAETARREDDDCSYINRAPKQESRSPSASMHNDAG